MNDKILVTEATGGLGSKVVNFMKVKTEVKNMAVSLREEKNEF